jgi:hypothetical protein
MKMSLPIIFIHKGYSDYMKYSLRQAKYSNPDSKIILLGDASNNKFDFVTHVNMKNYFDQAGEFAKVYQHYSTNPYGYELFCFQRWFVLKEYMEQNNMEEYFVCDTDVMLYANIVEIILENFLDMDVGIMFCSNNSFSAGISYWNKKSMFKFCNTIKALYLTQKGLYKIRNHWKSIQEKNMLGGVSDMTAVSHFYMLHQREINIKDLLEIKNYSVFDGGIIHPDLAGQGTYEFRLGKKIFSWRDSIPYSYNKKLKCKVKFNCIHFSGSSKYMIAYFYTGKTFKEKTKLDIKFKALNFVAFWYKILKIRKRCAWIFNIYRAKERDRLRCN